MTAAHLRVDLGRLCADIDTLRARIAPAQLMCVVKNDAYAHGIEQVVAAAHAHGVRWFGAFDVPMGMRARGAAGPDARVFSWVTVSRDEIATALDNAIELGVGDARYLDEVAAVSAGRGAVVHLKIDTGLHRNGVRPEAWSAFVTRAAELENDGVLEVVGVWSHIAEASDSEDDDARAVFEAALSEAHEAGLRPAVRHLAASAASFARPEFRYDMVRVGAFCYGIRSAGGPSAAELGLVPAARLEAEVVSVGDRSVTIAAGALDGLPSSLQGRAVVGTPAGARALLVVGGTESLVASWPDAKAGDAVAIYGPGGTGEGTATDLAELVGTIGEEIAVRVSPLVPRVYAGE